MLWSRHHQPLDFLPPNKITAIFDGLKYNSHCSANGHAHKQYFLSAYFYSKGYEFECQELYEGIHGIWLLVLAVRLKLMFALVHYIQTEEVDAFTRAKLSIDF